MQAWQRVTLTCAISDSEAAVLVSPEASLKGLIRQARRHHMQPGLFSGINRKEVKFCPSRGRSLHSRQNITKGEGVRMVDDNAMALPCAMVAER